MSKIFDLEEIKKRLDIEKATKLTEEGFVLYSQGKGILPEPGVLPVEKGSAHIKFGGLKGGKHFVVKIATGFHDNSKIGLPTTDGLMLLFDQETGCLAATLFDEAYLTDLRTALAGAIAARYLAPEVSCVGIVGTGIQARCQLQQLERVTNCRNVIIWGRNREKAEKFIQEFPNWQVRVAKEVAEVGEANLIVTTTNSSKPLLMAEHVKPGTHITGIGVDEPGKGEIDPKLFEKARVIVDSRDLSSREAIEIGEVIANTELHRKNNEEITLFESRGIAIQDLMIAEQIISEL